MNKLVIAGILVAAAGIALAAGATRTRFVPLTEDQINNLTLDEAREVIRILQPVVVSSDRVIENYRRRLGLPPRTEPVEEPNAATTRPAPRSPKPAPLFNVGTRPASQTARE